MARGQIKIDDILKRLETLANPDSIEGMKRFGIITSKRLYGVSIPNLRKIAKEIGINHNLALQLYNEKCRETQIIASMIDDPDLIDEKQMEEWVKEFDCWEICDQVCLNLFVFSKYAYQKVIEWSNREDEYVKRAAFSLIACLAFKNKKIDDGVFIEFLKLIKRESDDERNFVKKAVNWALRQIGKRNLYLNEKAIEIAREIQKLDSRAAKWIAKDALRELCSNKVKLRLLRIIKRD